MLKKPTKRCKHPAKPIKRIEKKDLIAIVFNGNTIMIAEFKNSKCTLSIDSTLDNSQERKK